MPSDNSTRTIPEMNWRGRLSALHYLTPLFRLVWEASAPLVLAAILLRLVGAVLPLATLWVAKMILDSIVVWMTQHSGDVGSIVRLVALDMALAVLTDLCGRASSLCDSLLADRFTNHVSLKLMRHANVLDIASFEDPDFLDKLERARQTTTSGIVLVSSLMLLGQNLLSQIALSFGLLVVSPWLMLLLVAAIIPSFLGETHFSRLTYSVLHNRTPQRRQLDYLRQLGTSSYSAKEVKIFGLGEHLSGLYKSMGDRIEAENSQLATRRAAAGWVLKLISITSHYGAYAVVLSRTLTGSISLGMFSFLTRAFARSRSEIEKMLMSFNEITNHSVFVKELFSFFEIQPKIRSVVGAIPAPRAFRQGFEFRNVGFQYSGSSRWVVRNINFRLEAGEKIALVGENGAGKSTLVKLLARLYDPLEGQILLDGTDLREYDLEDLRSQIGVIFQDYMRYDALVRENIGFGNVKALHDRGLIALAAQKSMAKPVIDRFDNGYEQMLGKRFDGGVDLSGGEWQKFALARAYMRDAQLLILDEPTATLDPRAEFEVFQRFSELTRERTVVLISHRFSTVRMADRILMLVDGEIREQGTHRELLTVGGTYAELFKLQAAGFSH